MSNLLTWIIRSYGGLLKYRWYLVGLVMSAMFLLELYEHQLFQNFILTPNLIAEIGLDAILLPVFGGVLLSLTVRVTNERLVIVKYLNDKAELSRQINNAPQLNDLLRVIVEYPRQIVSVIGAELLLNEPALEWSETRVVWHDPYLNLMDPSLPGSADVCTACSAQQIPPGPLQCSLELDGDVRIQNEDSRYCVPLVNAHQLVAILYLLFPPGFVPTQIQQKVLAALAPDMAVAIDTARHRRLNAILKEKADREHRQIVRELHDNLAHGLIDVRNRLDLLASGETLPHSRDLRQNLGQVRDMVENVYVDLRATLKDLESNPQTELCADIQEYILSIQNRVGYQIRFSTHGLPQPVPARLSLNVIYIVREILSNIDRHAGASQVDVRLDWQHERMLLTIADNGHGFNLAAAPADGHFGLKIIRERAEDIKGKLEVKSTQGAGTQVSLWLPLWLNSLQV
jgi:signal transduction histidine kinase